MLKNNTKKQLLVFVLLSILLISFGSLRSNAAGLRIYDDTNKYYFQETDTVEQELYGVSYEQIKGETNAGDQNISLFSMKTDGLNSKLVSWAIQDGNKTYKRGTLTAIAQDYEKTHPGWKVVAGINADQFTVRLGFELNKDGGDLFPNQPYYAAIYDGERRFAYSVTANQANSIGFTNNGTANGFVNINGVAGLYVEVIDEDGNVLSKHPVEKINESASSNKTSVWFAYTTAVQSEDGNDYTYPTQKLDVTGNNLFFVSNAELAYMSNSKTYAFYKGNWACDHVFGRGTIDQVTNSVTELAKGQFVIESNDPELVSKLDKNVRVRVQYSYADETLNNIEYASGYHIAQRINGKDAPVEGDYNTKQYPRSVFGIKKDGTYILMAADMSQKLYYKGLNNYETNAFLKANGVVSAYQDDGGGSATGIFRNQDGGFDVTNNPSDGGQRSILSGLFFVVKESGIKVSSYESTEKEITLTIDTSEFDMENVSNIYCYLDGQRKPFENNQVTFKQLDGNSSYDYYITFDRGTLKDIDAIVHGTATTSKKALKFGGIDIDVDLTENKVTFTPSLEDVDGVLDYFRIYVGDKAEAYIGEPITFKFGADIYELEYSYVYTFDLNDGKGMQTVEVKDIITIKEKPVEETPVEEPETGCKKDLLAVVISLISLVSTLLLFRKRK